MLDLHVTMPQAELDNLLSMTQISYTELSEKGSGNLPDYKYENATVVVNWEG